MFPIMAFLPYAAVVVSFNDMVDAGRKAALIWRKAVRGACRPTSFDRFTGVVQVGDRHRPAETSGCPDIHHQQVPGRLLDRQVAGVRAVEDLVDEVGRPPHLGMAVDAVGEHGTGLGEERVIGHDRKVRLCHGSGRKRGPSSFAARTGQKPACSHVGITHKRSVDVLANWDVRPDSIVWASARLVPDDQGQDLPWSPQFNLN
nr:hypothetical protein [Microvirga arsenatis]